MSKSPNSNILIPAISGAALLLGGAFAIANIDYGNDQIDALQASFDREREASGAHAARVAELEARLAQLSAEADERIASVEAVSEEKAAVAAQAIATLQAQLQTVQTAKSVDSDDAMTTSVVASTVETTSAAPDTTAPFQIGREALAEELAAWDVDVLPDGRGLPDGSGDVSTGDKVFGEKCASCHGDFAEGRGAWPVLAGGFDTLDDRDPVKTVGSYWPYLSTVWDYVHRSMPFGNAGTLTDDEVYAITAYILYSNDLVGDDFTLSRETFAEVEMYNTGGFIVDDRSDTEYAIFIGEPCMENCKDTPPEITRRSSDVGVTPADDGSMVESAMEIELAKLGGREWGAERVAGSVFMDPDRMAADEAARDLAESDQGGEQVADNAATEEAPEDVVAEESTDANEVPDPELVAAGEKVFRQCKSCHQVGDGAKNRSGPHLNGVVGRVFGSVDGFKYSNAFQEANAEGRKWTEEELQGFLADPKGYLKGTRMSFRGIKGDDDLASIIAYLSSFSE